MSVKICHISDSHGIEGHEKLIIPQCDILIHTGDIGGRTDLRELNLFLCWMEKQPADVKIFCAGNHDIVLDKQCYINMKKSEYINAYNDGNVAKQMIMKQQHEDAMYMIEHSSVKYLCNKDYVYKGLKIYGCPYTPSFHRLNGWAFNANRGAEMQKQLSKIPSDIDVLITHGPPYGILDLIPEKFKQYEGEDVHRGCEDMLNVIKKRLLKLKLMCFGHIHDQVGIVLRSISNSRRILFSNGAILTNDYTQLVTNPLIITL